MRNARRVLKKCESGSKRAQNSTLDTLGWHFRADTKYACGTSLTVADDWMAILREDRYCANF